MMKINLISTYDEVNLGDDLLLYAAMNKYKNYSNIRVNGKKPTEIFIKRNARQSKPHFRRLKLFYKNIYFGGTNFIFDKKEDAKLNFLRKIYYCFLARVFNIFLISNGITNFSKGFECFYKFCCDISVRDYESRKILSSKGIQSSFKRDPVISLFKERDVLFSDKEIFKDVGNIIILLGNQINLDPEAKSLKLGSKLISLNQFTHIIFFQDGEFIELSSDLTRIKVLIYDGSLESLKLILKTIRSANSIQSMRLHGILLAKLYGIKAKAIPINSKLKRKYVGV